MRLPFEDKAADELESIVRFFEEERPGYGRLFLAEVKKKVARAADYPNSGTRMSPTGAKPEPLCSASFRTP